MKRRRSKHFTTKILAMTATKRFLLFLHTSQQPISTCKFIVLILIPDWFEARFLIRVKKVFHLCGTYLNRWTYRHLLWHALKLLRFLVQDNLWGGTVCNGSALFEGPFFSTLVVMVCHFTPFLMATIIQQCMGNSNIAGSLVRYPVCGK